MEYDTLPSVSVQSRLKDIATAARAHLTALGPNAELSTASLAVAVIASRAEVAASLVPAEMRGEFASRLVDVRLMWRLERRAV